MKLAILAIILIFIVGCTINQDGESAQNRSSLVQPIPRVSGTQDLLLNEQDIQQFGMRSNGTGCQIEEYPTSERSPLAQYGICLYTIEGDDTQVVIELQKFTNSEDLNGTYQYSSLHLRGFEGLISENAYGDQSRFYVNNESAVYYYHLWISKNEYLIHITSKGSKEAEEYIAKIGQRILSRF
ncbi:hypothetical protein J4401_06500 [Candidatus Woesearchaeota archaeon]|nr:hypothetical protein [Candidatus Woesearchaeota archaeon]